MNNIISFKGVTNATMGVYVTTMPSLSTPNERGEAVPIPGRSGTVWKSENAWEPITLAIPIWVPPERAYALSAIKAWLTGQGPLRLGASADGYYDARISSGIEFAPLDYGDGYSATVTMECYPFRFLDTGLTTITKTAAGSITNPQPVFSEPLLAITASGDVEITVGDITFELTGVSGVIYVDTYKQECYTAAGLANDKMKGAFPRLLPGANAISWTGTVTQIVFTPRWMTL